MDYIKLFLANKNQYAPEVKTYNEQNEIRDMQTNGYFEQIKSGVDLSNSKGEPYIDPWQMLSIILMHYDRECPQDFRNNGCLKGPHSINGPDVAEHQRNCAILSNNIDLSEIEEETNESIAKTMRFRHLKLRTQ